MQKMYYRCNIKHYCQHWFLISIPVKKSYYVIFQSHKPGKNQLGNWRKPQIVLAAMINKNFDNSLWSRNQETMSIRIISYKRPAKLNQFKKITYIFRVKNLLFSLVGISLFTMRWIADSNASLVLDMWLHFFQGKILSPHKFPNFWSE